mmetsp:Transcript_5101/g.16218  ORF Transcript_5101/g.16218 Transcript_5101/m.16218 type:complete len:108 (+) Transcript_5101:92-415(+)
MTKSLYLSEDVTRRTNAVTTATNNASKLRARVNWSSDGRVLLCNGNFIIGKARRAWWVTINEKIQRANARFICVGRVLEPEVPGRLCHELELGGEHRLALYFLEGVD